MGRERQAIARAPRDAGSLRFVRLALALLAAALVALMPSVARADSDFNGHVTLRADNYERYIDRVILPDAARQLYDDLVEGSDNDGYIDFLIDDKYFDPTNNYDWDAYDRGEKLFKIKGGYGLKLASFGNLPDGEVDKAVWAAVGAFYRDHPEVFWLRGHKRYVVTRGDEFDGFYLVLRNDVYDMRAPSYRSAGNIKAAIEERDTIVRAILKEADEHPTVFGKIDCFNDWLTRHNEYNTITAADQGTIPDGAWSSLTALRGRTGDTGPVCEGYAAAFKVLCDAAGIPCVLTTSTDHEWNLVKLFDNWYAMDVTWNDPAIGPHKAISGNENDRYLLVGSDSVIEGRVFKETHPTDNTYYQNTVDFNNQPQVVSRKFVPTYAQKADPGLETTPSSLRMTPDQKVPAMLLGSGNRRVTIHSSNASVANVRIDGDRLTIMSGDPGTATLSFNALGSWEYREASAKIEVTVAPTGGTIPVYRLYNPYSHEHLLTTSSKEDRTLSANGWRSEGVAFGAPSSSDKPVYRLYNPYNGDHLYTASSDEYENLKKGGWKGEGIKLYSADSDGRAVYRLYNPYQTKNGGAFSHLWTSDAHEYSTNASHGWSQEGVAWYASH